MSAKVDEATKQSDGKTASSFGDEPAILHVDNASENPIVDDDVPGAEAPAGDTLAQTQSQDPKTTQRGFDRESHKKEGFQKSGNAPPSDVDNMPNHPLTRDIRLIMQGTDEDLKDFYRSEMRSMLDDGIQSDGRTNTSRLNDEPQGRPMRRSNTEWVDVRTRGYGDTETEADSMTTGSSLPPRNFRERARKEQEKSRSKRARYRGEDLDTEMAETLPEIDEDLPIHKFRGRAEKSRQNHKSRSRRAGGGDMSDLSEKRLANAETYTQTNDDVPGPGHPVMDWVLGTDAEHSPKPYQYHIKGRGSRKSRSMRAMYGNASESDESDERPPRNGARSESYSDGTRISKAPRIAGKVYASADLYPGHTRDHEYESEGNEDPMMVSIATPWYWSDQAYTSPESQRKFFEDVVSVASAKQELKQADWRENADAYKFHASMKSQK